MGIYDRDYYRRDGSSFLGSFAERGKVCKWLIGINVVAFVIQVVTRTNAFGPAGPGAGIEIGNPEGWFTGAFELSIPKVLHGEVWRLLTYAFLHDHANLLHILFNMLLLWWFGNEVESIYGPKEFLAIYLLSAVLGGVAFVLTGVAGITRGELCVGASGAVMAVLILCALHFPSRIILLFFFLPVPIWLFALFLVAQDLFGFLGRSGGRTAVSVHLAGAAFALIYYKSHIRLLDLLPNLRTQARRRYRPRLRVYRGEEEQTPVHAGPRVSDLDEQLEAKMDAVLKKVQDSGLDSLTPNEREILVRASEVYKRRRE